ncbi:hypothetical protein WCP94_002001 [Bilophila wadsworthia]
MRACRERPRYSHCLVRKPLHASSIMIERKNGTVRFLPRKGQASSLRIWKRPSIR